MTGHALLGLPIGKWPAFRVETLRESTLPGRMFREVRLVQWIGRQGLLESHYRRVSDVARGSLIVESVEELADCSLEER